MRFLADLGISASTTTSLRQKGHEVVHLREEGLQRLSDEQILDKTEREQRVVLTFDLDFGDLMAAGARKLPSVVIFRLQNQMPSLVTTNPVALIAERKGELRKGLSCSLRRRDIGYGRLPIE